MTPTEAIAALEKALEAGPTQESEWLSAGSCVFELTTRGRHEVNRWAAFVQTAGQAHELSVSDCSRLADYLAACSPLAIRTILDAHAGALRDAAKLREALTELSNFYGHVWDLVNGDLILFRTNISRYEAAQDKARAALATTTKAQP